MRISPDVDLDDVMTRIRDGDAEAWAALTGHFTNLLWSIARGARLGDADAADAIQTTWLRLVENIGRIREPERLGAWLATTLRRECSEIRRRVARQRPASPDHWDEIESSADPLDEALIRDERDAALWRAFAELRPACRSLLRILMADPTPSYVEVSAALGIPIGSVGPTRQRCLKCLRDIMLAQADRAAGNGER
jgi:RNA polymerase sigma factor (sigma-70 family)